MRLPHACVGQLSTFGKFKGTRDFKKARIDAKHITKFVHFCHFLAIVTFFELHQSLQLGS